MFIASTHMSVRSKVRKLTYEYKHLCTYMEWRAEGSYRNSVVGRGKFWTADIYTYICTSVIARYRRIFCLSSMAILSVLLY